jgi:hypothetical protein
MRLWAARAEGSDKTLFATLEPLVFLELDIDPVAMPTVWLIPGRDQLVIQGMCEPNSHHEAMILLIESRIRHPKQFHVF